MVVWMISSSCFLMDNTILKLNIDTVPKMTPYLTRDILQTKNIIFRIHVKYPEQYRTRRHFTQTLGICSFGGHSFQGCIYLRWFARFLKQPEHLMKKHVRKHLHPISFRTIGHLHDHFLNRIPSRHPANKDSWDFLTQMLNVQPIYLRLS